MKFIVSILLLSLISVSCAPPSTYNVDWSRYQQQQPIVGVQQGYLGQNVQQQQPIISGQGWGVQQPIQGGLYGQQQQQPMYPSQSAYGQQLIDQQQQQQQQQPIMGGDWNNVQQQQPIVGGAFTGYNRQQQQFPVDQQQLLDQQQLDQQQIGQQQLPISGVRRGYMRSVNYLQNPNVPITTAPLMQSSFGNQQWNLYGANKFANLDTGAAITGLGYQSKVYQNFPVSQQEQAVMTAQWKQQQLFNHGITSAIPVSMPVQSSSLFQQSNQQLYTLPLTSGMKQQPIMTFAGKTTNQPIVQSAVYSNLPTQVNTMLGSPSAPVQQPITAYNAIWRTPLYQRNQPLVQQPILNAKNAQFMQTLYPNAELQQGKLGLLQQQFPQQQFNQQDQLSQQGQLGQQQFPQQGQQFPQQQGQQFPQDQQQQQFPQQQQDLPQNQQFGAGMDQPANQQANYTNLNVLGGQQQQMMPMQSGADGSNVANMGGMQQQQMFVPSQQQQQQ